MREVQREIALPLYYQVAGIIRSKIIDGEWQDGDKIPSETKLAPLFGVSVVTIRQALERLKSEGLLQGRQGSGTFVTYHEPVSEHVVISVPLDSVALPMAGYDSELLGREIVRPPRPVAEMLGDDVSETCVRIQRVRMGAEGRVNFSTSYIPHALGDKLTDDDLRRPLLMEALEDRGQRFTRAFQTIEASVAGPEEARVLQVPLGSALLLVRRSYEIHDGTVAYVVENRHPSGKFRYEAILTRTPDRASPPGRSDDGPRWALDNAAPTPPKP